MTTERATLPQLLAQLADADDDTFTGIVLRFLLRPEPVLAQALQDPSMRQRTVGTLKRLLVQADQNTRKDVDPGTRGRWQQIRTLARQARDRFNALPPPVDADARPRQRALQRLAAEFPDDWAQLVGAARGRPVSLRRLVHRHHHRFAVLRNEELSRAE